MSEFLFGPVPHDEAMKFIAGKPVVSRQVFDNLLPELKARAFTVTGIEGANILQAIRDRIAELPAGANWDDVKADIVENISPFLVDPEADAETQAKQQAASERRAELLIRTHGFQAYQAAAFNVAQETKDTHPFFRYLTMEDDRVRDAHAALDGLILPIDDPFWQDHYPPWDWGCRCQVVSITPEAVEEIQQTEADLAPEEKSTLSPVLLDRLHNEGKLTRGPSMDMDVRSPRAQGKEGAFYWHPGDLRIPLAELQKRYDPATWAAFETWAKAQKLTPKKTVWDWLNPPPKKPRAKKAAATAVSDQPSAVSQPEPTIAETPVVFPATLDGLREVRSLGGSTGAMLMEDPSTGKRFVLKRGNSPTHIRSEAAVNQAYRELGVPVPATKLYDGTKPAQLTEFIEGKTLREFLATPAGVNSDVIEQIRKGFAADVLMGNWDVAGLNLDNIIVDARGKAWRIDNGGSLAFRAQGAAKTADQWNEFATELWTLRDKTSNEQTASIFGSLEIYDIARQIEGKNLRKILPLLPETERVLMEKRIGHLEAIATKALDMQHDQWRATYADDLTRHMMGLRKDGIVADLPKLLDQAEGETTVKDENGVPFDFLRTPMATQASGALSEDVFFNDLLAAVKTVNGHGAKGDFQFNQEKISKALGYKPALQQLAKAPNPKVKAMAKSYLGTIADLEASIASAKPGEFVPVPKFKQHVPKGATAAKEKESIVARVASYMEKNGGDQAAAAHWMGSQGGSSWSDGALGFKHFVSENRIAPKSAYYWSRKEAKAAAEFGNLKSKYGDKLEKGLTMWHAFVQEVLAATAFRYNDRANRLVRLIRTENHGVVQRGLLSKGKNRTLKRGANESASVFRPVFIHGKEITVQAVPHSRVTGLYMLEQSPGYRMGSFLSDSENEITFIPEGLVFDYVNSVPLDGGSDATQWGIDLVNLRKANS